MTLNELVPTYGNWGGPGWSGGKRTVEGEAPDPTVEGRDALDELFKAHDFAYWDAENESDPVKAAKMIYDADVSLLRDMDTLKEDPSGIYDELAEGAFEVKKFWDLAQIALEQLDELADNISDGIADAIGDLFDMAQSWFPRPSGDPLVLDLDGDGVETINVSGIQRVLFDTDGDGVKTATGWVNRDDTLLVLDRNGNGTIDNGSELFGDETLVNVVKATDGFVALRAEDTNANGLFDEGDSNFINVRLWQDVNQNGISEANELFTLNAMNVQSINLTADEAGWTNNGNLQTHSGTYTKTDGTTGDVGNLLFTQESFYRNFTDTIPLTQEAKALPQMQGSGMVRDLREAMSMQSIEGETLADMVTQYFSLTTRDEQMAMIDSMLKAWGATSGFKDIASEAVENGYTLTTNLDENQFAMLSVLEQFNGRHFHRMPWETVSTTTAVMGLIVDSEAKTVDVTMWGGQLWFIEQAYQQLVESVYSGLLLQTRLAPYLESITIDFTENGLIFDVSPIMVQLKALQLGHPRDALIDHLELIQYAGKNLSMMGWNWSETLQTMMEQIGTQIDAKAIMGELGYLDTDSTMSNHLYDVDGTNKIDYYGDANAVLAGFDGNDIIQSGYRDDLINGGKGDDEIYDENGNDTYVFNLGDGQDIIYDSSWGATGHDTIAFGAGISQDNLSVTLKGYNLVISIQNTEDTITIVDWYMNEQNKIELISFSNGGSLSAYELEERAIFIGTDGNDTISGYMTNDTIYGGKGDDQLYGDDGNDTYIFNLGDGHDTINDYSYNIDNSDTIQFGASITASMVTMTRDQSNLYFSINGTMDKITIAGHFDMGENQIEQIRFDDGTLWNNALINSAQFVGTDGSDAISGTSGNDTFVGKQGNDYFYDQDGSDTYIFNLSDGQDTIYDYSTNTGNKDTIQFGAGITADKLNVTRIGDDLVIMIKGATDKITIGSYFSDATYQIEVFSFAYGALLNNQQIEEMIVLRGTEGNDILSGYMSNDTLIGEKGDDQLYGDDGSDIYIFNLGDGQDIISDYSYNVGNNDTIQFGTNITASMITMSRDQSNLYFSINGTTDKITVTSHFDMVEYQIEQVTFADVTVWDNTVLNSTHFIGTDGSDFISGTDGNNTFEGKKGNDYFDDYNGSDTYIFNLGDGTDTIYDYSTNTGNKDIIQFGAGIKSSDLEVVRNGNDLIFSILGTTDTITVSEWYTNTQNKIEQFSFADGSILTATQVQRMLTFLGTAGNDALVGTASGDILKGFAGNDTLNGKLGNDTLVGGTGNDVFVFNTTLNSTTNKDTISDFTSGADKIQLENAIFTKLTIVGALNSAYFKANATGKATDSNDYIVYNTTSGILSYDADGTGAGVAVQIALLGTSTHPTITASSFVVS